MNVRTPAAWLGDKCWIFILTICVCSFSWSCGAVKTTNQRLKEQELRQLKAELASVTDLNHFLDQNPTPDTSVHVTAFLSADVINEVLSKADRIRTPLKQAPSIVVGFDSIRASFTEGYPKVIVQAWARRGSLKLELSVSAALNVKFATTSPPCRISPCATLGVEILDVVPVVRWNPVSFRIQGFVKDLLKVTAINYSEMLPTETVPITFTPKPFIVPAIETDQTYDTKDNDKVTKIGTITVHTSVPAMSATGSIQLVGLLFLSNGVHFLLSYTPT
jgi:hypothetical protein